jgi:hypothetical protein
VAGTSIERLRSANAVTAAVRQNSRTGSRSLTRVSPDHKLPLAHSFWCSGETSGTPYVYNIFASDARGGEQYLLQSVTCLMSFRFISEQTLRKGNLATQWNKEL